ncbi:hypothetical protein EVAR_91597_1 [Eumeta japonica]|uniref:Uncharacterized protein n=1 Tax=Eumeta variegata TaxID=151549 RepID=A0A4C1UXW6_EUMVA|nr:hypothetical protein EVAR_91597_1 [Eumeta japonica]
MAMDTRNPRDSTEHCRPSVRKGQMEGVVGCWQDDGVTEQKSTAKPVSLPLLWSTWLQHKSMPVKSVRYHTLTEYRHEVVASAVAFRPLSENFILSARHQFDPSSIIYLFPPKKSASTSDFYGATLFYYGGIALTFRHHHQTLKSTHGESTSQDGSNKLKDD